MDRLFFALKDAGMNIWLQGTEIKVAYRDDTDSDGLLAMLRANKTDVIQRLRDNGIYSRKDFESQLIFRGSSTKAVLSFAQERMLFVEEYEEGTSAYHMPLLLSLKASTRCELFLEALAMLCVRHEILRTMIRTDEHGETYQIITDEKLCIEWLDVNASNRATVLGSRVNAPFDLSSSLPIKVFVLNDAEGEGRNSEVLIIIHHIACDGWSLGILLEELEDIYRSLEAVETVDRALPQIRYMDYAEWQRHHYSGASLRAEEEFWRQYLQNSPSINLPLDQKRPHRFSYEGGDLGFSIDKSVCEQLLTLAKAEGATLYEVLYAAFLVFLYKYTGQKDIVIGTFGSNRDLPESQGCVGCFVNTLPVRSQIEPSHGVGALIKNVHRGLAEIHAHQAFPLDKILQAIHVERDPSKHPLFQVIFGMNGVGIERAERSCLYAEVPLEEHNVSVADLALYVKLTGDKISCQICYAKSLFDSSSIEQMAVVYQAVLASFCSNSDLPISSIKFQDYVSSGSLLEVFNGARVEYQSTQLVHELFEAQAAVHAEKCAIIGKNASFSFGHLNAYANQLARLMAGQGVGPGKIVGVFVERSSDMVVALLAVLKTGAAYLPLDPHYPPERLEFMISDSGAEYVIARARPRLPGDAVPAAKLFDLADDKFRARLAEFPRDNPVRRHDALSSAQLMYVIYTSGSTGVPKGVMIQHQNVINLFVGLNQRVKVDQADVWLALTSICFDISVLEIFWTLCSGASIVISPDSSSLELDEVAFLIEEYNVSSIQITPSHLAEWLKDRAVANALAGVKKLLVGGEAMPDTLVESIKNATMAEIFNMYGPTETTVWSAVERVEHEALIGRPLANTVFFVLDQDKNEVPVGAQGELYIGGDGLAVGYLGNEELTAAKFVTINVYGDVNHLLYATGDVVRRLHCGRLAFIGRTDSQIKLRGHRIELGEIEQALSRQANVSQAVVALKTIDANQYLIGYLVLNDKVRPESVDTREILMGLRRVLPRYMIPHSIVFIDALPLTPNKKIDRSALPAVPAGRDPVGGLELTSGEGELASGDHELALMEVWRNVLGCEKIGVHDNFFDSGGTSLLAMRVVSKARALINCTIPLSYFFDFPTIREQANYIGRTYAADCVENVLPTVQQRGAYELSSSQQRMFFLNRFEGSDGNYNICSARRLRGDVDLGSLRRALSCVVGSHSAFRTSFITLDEQPRQVLVEQLDVPIEYHDLSGGSMDEGEVKAHGIIKRISDVKFDLAHAPLVKVGLVKIDRSNYIMVFNIHHIIADGWSIDLIWSDLSSYYRCLDAGEDAEARATQYRYVDYAHWHNEFLQTELVSEQLKYWRDKLNDAPAILEFPCDLKRPHDRSTNGSVYTFHIDSSLKDGFERLARQKNCSLFIVLIAIYKVILSRFSNQNDVVVGSPVANRKQSEFEDVVGMFVNTLVFRTVIDPTISMDEIIDRVRTTCLEAYDNQDAPFEKIVEQLGIERTNSYSSLFQHMMVLHEPLDTEKLSDSVTLERFKVGSNFAKFDMILAFTPVNDHLLVEIEYNTDLLSLNLVERFAQSFVAFSTSLLAHPFQVVGKMDVVGSSDRAILESSNQRRSETGFSKSRTVLSLIERQVSRVPGAPAVYFNRKTLSYAQLDRDANRLAHCLIDVGLKPRSLVAIGVNRSFDMLVAVLAVWKAGCAFLPVDISLPSKRLKYILDDSNVDICLTLRGLNLEALDVRTTFIKVDALDTLDAYSNQKPDLEPAGLASDDLAYVIYTSGSTGAPKGVKISHEGLLNISDVQIQRFSVESSSKILQFASFSFDMAIWDIVMALCSGGQLVLIDEDTYQDVGKLNDFVREAKVTHATLPPAILSSLELSCWHTVKTMVVAGEDCPLPMAQTWSQGRRFYNAYGPTETTICATILQYENGKSWSLGSAINNVSLLVLNEQYSPQPVGVTGELFIAGVGVSNGYLHKPDLTKERFLKGEEIGLQDTVVYRTGDLVRWSGQGELVFVGRKDDQVKVRGHRVELGEVENAVLQMPEVKQAAAVCSKSAAANQLLVLYAVLHRSDLATNDLTVTKISEFLKRTLPQYMLPNRILIVDQIQLSASGKIDRKSLAESCAFEDALVVRDPAVTPSEKALESMWTRILKRPSSDIGRASNFFGLGGHSLLAAQLIGDIKRELRIDLSVRAIFDFPVLKELASAIDEKAGRNIYIDVAERNGSEREWLL